MSFRDKVKTFCDQNNIILVGDVISWKDKLKIITTECGHEKDILWTNLKALRGTNCCAMCYPFSKFTYEKCSYIQIYNFNFFICMRLLPAKERKYLSAEYNNYIYEYDNPEDMEKLMQILTPKSI